jgi:photosystem II stability/assembly factor-like uncharacterized protein
MKNLKHLLLICLSIACISTSYAQSPIKKEDRQGRLQHEFEMYKNPKTGKIPNNIRKKELDFIHSEKANLYPKIIKSSNASSQAAALDWKVRGPFNQGGRTKAIGIDSRDEKIILAGGTSGGMYRTTDSGTSWTSVTKPLDNPSITGVAQDPLAKDTWYYITGEVKESVNTNQSSQLYVGDGVFKSTDNGVTWNQLASTDPTNDAIAGQGDRSDWQFCHDIKIDPNGAILIGNDGGIYRSTDSGVSWTKVLVAAGLTSFGDVIHIDVAKVDANNLVYYAGTHNTNVKAFHRSTDGITWTDLTDPPGLGGLWGRTRVSIAKSNTNIVWFLAAGRELTPKTSQLFKYDHSTTTWTDFTDKLPALGGNVGNYNTQDSYNMVMVVKPDDENAVFIAGTKLWRSKDAFATGAIAANTGNTTWIGGYSPDNDVNSYPGHHPDVHELIFFPGNPKKALCGHDGGVSVTTDIMANDGIPNNKTKPHPVTWTLLNNGLFTTQAYAISIDPTTSGSANIVAGFQDNGNYRTTANGASTLWGEEPYGGDGSWNATAPGGDTWYISQQNGTVERNSKATPAGPGVNPSAAGSGTTNTFITPFILDRVDANIMYYTAKLDLWRNNSISTINVGGGPFDGTAEDWTKLTLSKALEGNITALETSVTPANVLYIGTSKGEVYRIDGANTGANATLVDVFTGKGLSTGFISSIDVDPADSKNVFLTYSNYGIISIYNSNDSGASWSNISGNLEEKADGTGVGPAIRWIHVFKKTDNSSVYYVGATTGLYSTETLNGLNTAWTQEGTTTLGNVPVSMIRSRKVDGYIAVGTHGKGMFSANFTSTTNSSETDFTSFSLSEQTGAASINTTNHTISIEVTASTSLTALKPTFTLSSGATVKVGTTLQVSSTTANDYSSAVTYIVTGQDGTTTQNWVVTVNTPADITLPTVSDLSPTDDATNVAIDVNLVITFDEDVVDGGGKVTIKDGSDDSVVESIAVSSSNITIDKAVATINPTADLINSADYYVEIEATAFKDAAGNNYTGITDKTTWNFTTVAPPDVTAPTVTALSPSDGASDVAIESNLVMTFTEEVVDDETGAVIIRKMSDDSMVETIEILSGKITIDKEVITINPGNDLEASTEYYVEIAANVFKDDAGNFYSGISDKTTWNFTTLTITGIEELSIKDQMEVTAITNGIDVKFLNLKVSGAEMNIYNMEGKRATFRSISRVRNGSTKMKAMLKPGIYILVATTDQGVFTEKFLTK